MLGTVGGQINPVHAFQTCSFKTQFNTTLSLMPRSVCLKLCVYKEAVVSARRLLQNFQFPDKNCRDISRYIYTLFAFFKNSYVNLRLFLSEPQMMPCGTLFQKQWPRCVGLGSNPGLCGERATTKQLRHMAGLKLTQIICKDPVRTAQ